MSIVIAILLLLVVAYLMYSSYNGNGEFDLKKGALALGAAAVGIWAYVTDFASNLIGW
ncbi:MAG: hypothetical protein RLZZ599_1450 [Bacteroidota bacterium]|jgi:hypothetical protein